MGWYECLSGSDTMKGARHASVVEEMEIKCYRDHHPPLKSNESLKWEGHLFAGYHLHKTEKDASTEYLHTRLPGTLAKINTE
jgi:hypothetical protein